MAASSMVITMTMREADRLKTIQAVVDRMLRVGQAAQRLGVSRRQVERMLLRYHDEGAKGLVSRQRGGPSHHQLESGLADRASRLMQLHFAPTESTFAYFEAARAYLERYGKPVAFYSDKASIFRATHDSTEFGRSVTQFGRALYELNIDTFCANSSQAKGRVERANLTLQDRLVKELRLRRISSMEAANAFAAHFAADLNARFAKDPRSTFDAHRPVRTDENLDEIFTWRVQRKVTQSLTLQHEKQIYLLADTPKNRQLIHRYIDVWEYPDGQLQIRADGRVLEYQRYDRLPIVDSGAVVENKRLGHALQVAQVMQAQRDDRRRPAASRTHRGEPANLNNLKQRAGTKAQRAFTTEDLEAAIRQVCAPAPEAPFKPRRAVAVSSR